MELQVPRQEIPDPALAHGCGGFRLGVLFEPGCDPRAPIPQMVVKRAWHQVHPDSALGVLLGDPLGERLGPLQRAFYCRDNDTGLVNLAYQADPFPELVERRPRRPDDIVDHQKRSWKTGFLEPGITNTFGAPGPSRPCTCRSCASIRTPGGTDASLLLWGRSLRAVVRPGFAHVRRARQNRHFHPVARYSERVVLELAHAKIRIDEDDAALRPSHEVRHVGFGFAAHTQRSSPVRSSLSVSMDAEQPLRGGLPQEAIFARLLQFNDPDGAGTGQRLSYLHAAGLLHAARLVARLLVCDDRPRAPRRQGPHRPRRSRR